VAATKEQSRSISKVQGESAMVSAGTSERRQAAQINGVHKRQQQRRKMQNRSRERKQEGLTFNEQQDTKSHYPLSILLGAIQVGSRVFATGFLPDGG
jgi:hypothetical protein